MMSKVQQRIQDVGDVLQLIYKATELAADLLTAASGATLEQAAEERVCLERAAWRKERDVQEDAWREECRVWAETETARLWEPWHLWQVRYVAYDALFSAAAAEEQAPIETVYTLDEPTDIVNGMKPVALVDRVCPDGEVQPGFALATFLDGVLVDYTKPKIDGPLRHHRAYWAGGYVVNVPAFVLAAPTAAPAGPGGDAAVVADDEMSY